MTKEINNNTNIFLEHQKKNLSNYADCQVITLVALSCLLFASSIAVGIAIQAFPKKISIILIKFKDLINSNTLVKIAIVATPTIIGISILTTSILLYCYNKKYFTNNEIKQPEKKVKEEVEVKEEEEVKEKEVKEEEVEKDKNKFQIPKDKIKQLTNNAIKASIQLVENSLLLWNRTFIQNNDIYNQYFYSIILADLKVNTLQITYFQITEHKVPSNNVLKILLAGSTKKDIDYLTYPKKTNRKAKGILRPELLKKAAEKSKLLNENNIEPNHVDYQTCNENHFKGTIFNFYTEVQENIITEEMLKEFVQKPELKFTKLQQDLIIQYFNNRQYVEMFIIMRKELKVENEETSFQFNPDDQKLIKSIYSHENIMPLLENPNAEEKKFKSQ